MNPEKQKSPGATGDNGEGKEKEFWVTDSDIIPPSGMFSQSTIEAEFRQAMRAAGVIEPAEIVADGLIHRYPANPEKPGDPCGWYSLHLDGTPAGAFGDWRQGLSHKFNAGHEATQGPRKTTAEIDAEKIERAKQAAAEAQAAAERARKLIEASAEAPGDHEYLNRAGKRPILSHGAKADQDGNLLIPISTVQGELTSYQKISPAGEKRFAPGGKIRGAGFLIGDPQTPGPLAICEGYATGAAISEELGIPVFCAMSAGNLEPAAVEIRAEYPGRELVFFADNDESQTGEREAKKAARDGERVILAPSIGDFNDAENAQKIRELFDAKPRPRGAFRKLSEIDFTPPVYLIDKLIEKGTINGVNGSPGSGKSAASLDKGLCIATGTPWAGLKTKQGPVLYISPEGSNKIRMRARAWEIANHTSLENAPFFVRTMATGLTDETAVEELINRIRESIVEAGPPALLIIDTLQRNYGPGDENSTQDMTRFVAALDKLKSLFEGMAVLIVHHTGHANKERGRGSSVLKASLDAEFMLEKSDDGIARFTVTKLKDGTPPEPMAFRFSPVELDLLGAEGEPLQSFVLSQIEYREPAKPGVIAGGKNQRRALEALENLMERQTKNLNDADLETEPRILFSDWREECTKIGLDRKVFYRVKKSLIAAMQIREDGNYVEILF